MSKDVYRHPDNVGCTYDDPAGKICAVLDCQARVLLRNLEDEKNAPDVGKRAQEIINDAHAAGCPNSLSFDP